LNKKWMQQTLNMKISLNKFGKKKMEREGSSKVPKEDNPREQKITESRRKLAEEKKN